MTKKKMDKTEDLGGLLKDYKNNYKYESRPYHKETPNFGHLLWINNRLESKIEEAINGGGSGLDLERYYIKVYGNKTPTENGIELETAYITAKTMSPAVDNRITLVVFPGEYGLSEKLVLDTAFIDLVSLTGNRDVILDRADVIGDPFDASAYPIVETSDVLLIDADNVYVKGMVGKLRNSPNFLGMMGTSDYILPLQVGDNLPNVVVENCKGGYGSFGGTIFDITPKEISGTYINVETFQGFNGNASGIFTDCIGGEYSFGGGNGGISSGTFTNCIGDIDSFGGTTTSGTYTNCIGGNNSFGGEASGTFTNCIGGDGSFGGSGGNASGTFTNCKGRGSSFGGGNRGIASGTFTNCIGGNNSFGSGFGSKASGTFTDCIGGDRSFGNGNTGEASGTFTDCIGGLNSFGAGGGTITGKLYSCRLTSGTFITVTSGGRTYYCIDGNGDVNDQ